MLQFVDSRVWHGMIGLISAFSGPHPGRQRIPVAKPHLAGFPTSSLRARTLRLHLVCPVPHAIEPIIVSAEFLACGAHIVRVQHDTTGHDVISIGFGVCRRYHAFAGPPMVGISAASLWLATVGQHSVRA